MFAMNPQRGVSATKVMALAIAWQYFNAVAEGRDDYAKTFLVIAPNVIVFERLRTDFEGGRHARRVGQISALETRSKEPDTVLHS